MNVSDQLLHAIRSCIEHGRPEVAGTLYAPDARLDAYLPGETARLHVAGDIIEAWGRWHGRPSRIVEWVAEPVTVDGALTGANIDVEWRDDTDGTWHRRTHRIHASTAGITRHFIVAARPESSRLRPPELGPKVEHLLDTAAAVERVVTRSGAPMDKLRTDSGEVFVIKYESPATDWLMRATGDRGREASLWTDRQFDRLRAPVAHAITQVEPYPGGSAVISRDLTPWLPRFPVNPESIPKLMVAHASLHTTFRGDPPAGLASIEQRWATWSSRVADVEFHECDQQPKIARHGWDVLDEILPANLASATRTISEDPRPVTERLLEYGSTLLHGDGHPDNCAFGPGEMVTFYDWGLATAGPPEVEIAWLANFDFMLDTEQLLTDYRSEHPDRAEALDLALLGQAAALLPMIASGVATHVHPGFLAGNKRRLEVWSTFLRRGLDVLDGGTMS